MTRRLLALLVLLASARSAVADDRPNVLLITVDDMNCDSVGAFGCRVPGTTPNIDRLASQGMRFEHAHVTAAICQPCRASIMTARYPHRSGALGFDEINPGVPTLVEALEAAGYRTTLLGKASHVVPSRKEAWDAIADAPELHQGRDPDAYGAIVASAIADAKAAGAPFFIMANAHDPHRPFAGSQQEAGRNPSRRKGYPAPDRTFSPDEIVVPGFLPDLPDVREEIAEYFSSVRRADQTVGAVLEALEDSGQANETLVVFLSDHGMPLPFAKTNCYRHSTRTPLVVRWPGRVEAGAVDAEHMVAGIDLAPTILDAAGLPNLDGADGRSFLPVLRGESQEGRDHVLTHINTIASGRAYPMRSVQDRRHGYIFNAWADGETVFRNESQSGLTMQAMQRAAGEDPAIADRVELFLHRIPEEFYDYRRDPDALNNLIDDPASQDLVRDFRRRMLAQMEATEDPQLPAFRQYLESLSAEPR